jgi:hypothetical protein
MTYLTIYQIEHLVKLNKKLPTLVKMMNGLKSSEISNQIGQNKMTFYQPMDFKLNHYYKTWVQFINPHSQTVNSLFSN